MTQRGFGLRQRVFSPPGIVLFGRRKVDADTNLALFPIAESAA